MRSKHFRVTDIGYKSAEMTNICISLFSFVGDYFSTEKRYICCVLVLKKHKTQKIKENEKKMSFGEKNGDKKCNILCNKIGKRKCAKCLEQRFNESYQRNLSSMR